jgi:hypothetical protein
MPVENLWRDLNTGTLRSVNANCKIERIMRSIPERFLLVKEGKAPQKNSCENNTLPTPPESAPISTVEEPLTIEGERKSEAV